jgi:two-component system response regulator MprA
MTNEQMVWLIGTLAHWLIEFGLLTHWAIGSLRDAFDTMAERILVIEDELKIADFLRRGLTYEGFTVEVRWDGESGLKAARDNPPDLVILDVMLPGLDGWEVCRRLRAAGSVPILMLTAKDSVPDRVKGFESGADDYVIKPFAFEELIARVRALLRRTRTVEETVLRFADVTLNVTTREVTRGNRKIELTTKEFDLLYFFMRHPRQVLTRELIYDRIWGYDFGGESNILEVYIRYLRTKLEQNGEPRLIQTVRGVGYALREE